MKVLLVSNNYVDRTRGGVELHVHNLALSLVKKGHQVEVVRTSPGAGRHLVESDDVPVVALLGDRGNGPVRSRGSLSLPYTRKLRFLTNFLSRFAAGVRAGLLLRKKADYVRTFDLIHHHDFITSAVISWILSPLGVRQVWTNHLGEFLIIQRLPVLGKMLCKVMTMHFAEGIGPSRDLTAPNAVSCPMTYIPNGVDTDMFVPLIDEERTSRRAKYGWRSSDIVAVVPRRWAPTKGVIFAAQAIASDIWPQGVKVLFAGAGESDFPEYSAEIRRLLSGSRVEHMIIDSLSASEMAEALQCADICVIPSVMEATSLSALEAMSVGLPVVCSEVGGLPEIVSQGKNGLLVPVGDVAALAGAIRTVSTMEVNERRRMGSRGQRNVLEYYSWHHIATKTLLVYQRALA